MLHGKIAGLYPSQCPAGQEDNFAILVDRLAAGGLQVWLQTDGRKPDLLEKLLKIKDVHVVCNLVGGPEASTKIFGGAPSKEELAKTIALVQATPDGSVRFLAMHLICRSLRGQSKGKQACQQGNGSTKSHDHIPPSS